MPIGCSLEEPTDGPKNGHPMEFPHHTFGVAWNPSSHTCLISFLEEMVDDSEKNRLSMTLHSPEEDTVHLESWAL